MARVISNIPFNPIPGLRGLGRDLKRTVKGEVPISYAFRSAAQRKAFDQYKGKIEDFEFKDMDSNWSKKRIAASLIGGYMAIDGTYRALSGGSMYRNRTGNRDFVGIPFI